MAGASAEGPAHDGTRTCGAHERNRTFDLLLTKEVLYRLSYVSEFCIMTCFQFRSMERETGIEPAPSAWKAEVLPLNYSRCGARPLPQRGSGGGRWIRTTEGVSQQIYSLPPLAAWVSLRSTPFWRPWPNRSGVGEPAIMVIARKVSTGIFASDENSCCRPAFTHRASSAFHQRRSPRAGRHRHQSSHDTCPGC